MSITPSRRSRTSTHGALVRLPASGRPRRLPLQMWIPRRALLTPSKHALMISAASSVVIAPLVISVWNAGTSSWMCGQPASAGVAVNPTVGGADDTDDLTRGNREGDVAQDGHRGVIAESHMLKGDLTPKRRRILRDGTLGNHLIGVAHCHDPLECHRHLRDRVGHLGEVAHRLKEFGQVSEENGQCARRHRAGKDEQRTPP